MKNLSKMIPILILILLTIPACEQANNIADAFNKAGDDVVEFSTNNPQVDVITNGSATNLGILFYGIATTIGTIFGVKKGIESSGQKQVIVELIESPDNTASIQSLKSSKLKKVARNAIKSS